MYIYVVYSYYRSMLLLEENGRKYFLQELILTSLVILLMRSIRVCIHTTITTLSVSIIQSPLHRTVASICSRSKHIMCKASRSHDEVRVHCSRGGTSPEVSRNRMVVLTLVRCNNNRWILERSLHSFLRVTPLRRASIVTPVFVYICNYYSFFWPYLKSIKLK